MCSRHGYKRIPRCLVKEELYQLVGPNAAANGLELLTARGLGITHAHSDYLTPNVKYVNCLDASRYESGGQYAAD